MADKYLSLTSSGRKNLKEASSVSSGSENAGNIVALNSSGKLDSSLLPVEETSSSGLSVKDMFISGW